MLEQPHIENLQPKNWGSQEVKPSKSPHCHSGLFIKRAIWGWREGKPALLLELLLRSFLVLLSDFLSIGLFIVKAINLDLARPNWHTSGVIV